MFYFVRKFIHNEISISIWIGMPLMLILTYITNLNFMNQLRYNHTRSFNNNIDMLQGAEP